MTTVDLKETWRLAKAIYGEGSEEEKSARAAYVKRVKSNEAKRARHQAMTDLGLVRVNGNLGGTYYE